MTALDLDLVREQFPAFSDPDLDGWAFFENAGGSYPCRQVIARLLGFYGAVKVQPHHPYPLAQRAGEAMDAGPASLAPWLGAELDEVHVGPSTSQNTYVLANAFRSTLSGDDAVVVTQQDHEANSGAWRRLADAGIEVREWAVDPDTGALDVADLERFLSDGRVKVVAFPHVSNVVGETNRVRDLCGRIKAAGAVSIVDGVAAAPHGLPDFGALEADVYLFSTYKTFGPHQGVMLVRRELAERLPNQGHFFNESMLSKRLVPAGPDHAQVAALAGIAEYLSVLDAHHFGDDDVPARERMVRLGGLWHTHEEELVTPLLAFLRDRDDVRILGPDSPDRRAPTISVVHRRPALELATELAEHRVMVGASHFYAYRLLEAMGVDPEHGALRMSLLHNTTHAEVEQLIDALDAVL
ncbi:MAG: aminotransferase class V-fold PLP-dependent enzyme [Actinobacteria bacterium]|nr:aminotransferase class V-fold PLP-dependent enzyme [Actinomycetota bacterium]